jgi:hypothetical protein
MSGWNLVSYLPPVRDSTVHALASVLSSAIVILGFDEGGLTYDPTIPPDFNTLKIMSPGYGYWIKLKTPKRLIYPLSAVAISSVAAKPLASSAESKDASSVVAPTREWISLWGNQIKLDGQLIPVGTVVKAVDKNGVTCGRFVVSEKGKFGLMPVYADDPLTENVEGPVAGEDVTIYVGDVKVPRTIKWTKFGDVADFNDVLAAIGGELRTIPKEFALRQNYPNPFNPTTTLRYELPRTAHVLLRVYNVLGQEVATLVDEEQNAGYYSVIWNSSTRSGGLASSGVYFCAISAGNFNKVIKMVVLK